ncbi:MAG: class aldolase/adducin family protein [Polaromonas sp.]|nr:class aldolase/adducin family protein [Polaromonas sp.]
MPRDNASGRAAHISDEEWQIRCDLAALYRLMAHFRWTDHIYTHISARLPGSDHHFLINRYGVHFHEMCASELVKIDPDARVVDGDPNGADKVNGAAFTVHSAIHMGRQDLMCVVHTHTAAGIGVSAQAEGLLPITQHSLQFYGHIGYFDYNAPSWDHTVQKQERARLVEALGPHDALILRNHGLVGAGHSIAEAFHTIYMLERSCSAQIAAQSGGGALSRPSRDVCERTAAFLRDPATRTPESFELFWEASLRLIENDKPDYRS